MKGEMRKDIIGGVCKREQERGWGVGKEQENRHGLV